jgi:hypothetical protein
MRKFFTAALLLCAASAVKAQHPKLENDTITYNNFKITVGDTLHLAYGSDNKKDFVFIQMGSAMAGVSKLQSNYSKSDVVIKDVYKQMGKVYAKGSIPENKALNMMGAGKVFIEVEGAIDNKELITD